MLGRLPDQYRMSTSRSLVFVLSVMIVLLSPSVRSPDWHASDLLKAEGLGASLKVHMASRNTVRENSSM